MQILLTSDGKYRPCSKHQDYITHEGRELSIHKGDTLQDAWTSDYMQSIRQHFLDNKQFEGCRECWRMQRMRLRSMRYDSYQYGTSERQVLNPLLPTRIEINASNFCNLKCRICYPNASSKWIKEHAELYGSDEKIYRNLPLPNLEQVKEWADSLEEVCFFGGEPLLSEENMELLDHFIVTGNAGRMSLLFNTNGTVFNEKIVERLRHFKRVRMYFSVDDIGKRFEYQRKGAKWEDVAENIGKAYRLSRSREGQNIDFKICCTVSIFNIYYFPEFFNYFEKSFPGLKIFWNLLFDPWELSVQLLPDGVKTTLKKRLEDELLPTFEMNEEETKTKEELFTFLDGSIDRDFFGFFQYISKHDRYRGESFEKVFPELNMLFSEHYTKPQNDERAEPSFFRSNELLFPAYNQFERLRKNHVNGSLHNLSMTIFDALHELSTSFGTLESIGPKIQWLRKNIDPNSVGTENFVSHVQTIGLFKLHDAIVPMNQLEFVQAMNNRFNLVSSTV